MQSILQAINDLSPYSPCQIAERLRPNLPARHIENFACTFAVLLSN
jgi:hypothetical protein